ncbi:MAG: glycosyltransferase family 2 protein [Candidatus Rokubacteria bacterium]|nr:glycosyltransferase family 2 protein [Candidatus Rokubacteria bacterium]
MKVTLIIPALDEAEVIGGLLGRVPRDAVSEVIVADNGSTDATAAVAAGRGARVVSERRRGYGAACWAGVRALAPDVDVAAFLDGDGSQHPEELPRVLEPLRRGEADLVLGARQFAGDHPLHASLGTWLVAALVSRRYGVRLADIGPFRAIRVDLLRRLRMRDRAFGWPVEMVVKAAALGARIVEVPVSHAPRQGGRSKVSGTLGGSVRAGYAFLATALRAARDVS